MEITGMQKAEHGWYRFIYFNNGKHYVASAENIVGLENMYMAFKGPKFTKGEDLHEICKEANKGL